MCLLCDDGDHSHHDDPGHDSFNIADCTGSAATCQADDHTPWFARAQATADDTADAY